MKCPHCNNEKFQEQRVRFSPSIKGEQVDAVVPALVCSKCEQPLMNSEQMNKLRRVAADEYRIRHRLLTSEQIVGFRKSFSMNQAQFADYLGVGEASIKRWETYYVQNTSENDHIRLKCDETYAEENALEIRGKHRVDEFSGNVMFNLARFQAAAMYLLPAARSPVYLNKALYYADFLHHRRHGRSITGARYVPLDHGPCPDGYGLFLKRMIEKDLIAPTSKPNELVVKSDVDLRQFDDLEMETLKEVFEICKADKGQTLYKKAHLEKSYLETAMYKPISYRYSKFLKIS